MGKNPTDGVVAWWHGGTAQEAHPGTLAQAVVMWRCLGRALIARAWCGSLSPEVCMLGGACRLLGREWVGEQTAF